MTTPTTMTADALALRIILSAKSDASAARSLVALRATVSHMVGASCPECSAGHDAIEDNGCTGRYASFRCTACGHGWNSDLY
jgi:transposase-like protein